MEHRVLSTESSVPLRPFSLRCGVSGLERWHSSLPILLRSEAVGPNRCDSARQRVSSSRLLSFEWVTRESGVEHQ
jgi:hypothetical protein